MNNKSICTMLFLLSITFLSIIYSLFSFEIDNKEIMTSLVSFTDVEIKEIKDVSCFGSAEDIKSFINGKEIFLYPKLHNIGDKIVYTLVIKNKSNIKVSVSDIIVNMPNENYDYLIDKIKVSDELKPFEEKEFSFTVMLQKDIDEINKLDEVRLQIDFNQK